MSAPAAKRNDKAERRYRRAALVSTLAVLAIVYLAFWGGLPLQSHDELRGVFSSANQLREGNPVRTAGIQIGEVTAIEKGPDNTSVVTMRLDRMDGLHSDASLAIEPRLFFEGNFYVNVKPGTPAAAPLRSDATIPLARTSVPVQLDQVLNVLTTPTRDALNSSVKQMAIGLGGSRSEGTGSGGLRRAARELDGALQSFEQVAHAAQGTRPGDLRRAVGSTSDFTSQLARDPAALARIVTNFDRVSGALAANDKALSAGIRELDGVMRAAPRSLASLDSALPVATRFADALRPGLRAAPQALHKTNRMLRQIAALVRPRELPALLDALEPVASNLPALEQRLRELFAQLTPVGRCVSDVVVPALNQEVPDGKLSTGDPAWLDLMHMGTNAIGAGPSVDGNGTTIRVGVAGGEQSLQGFLPGVGNVVASGEVEGVRPTWLGYGVEMPWRPDAPCHEQKIPDLGARSGGPPKWLRPGPAMKPNAAAQKLLSDLFTKGPESVLQRLLRQLPKPEKRKRAARPGVPAPNRILPSLTPGTQTNKPPTGVRLPKLPDALSPLKDTAPGATVKKLLDSVLGKRGGR